MKPLVSVPIDTHRERYDGSTDRTPKIVPKYGLVGAAAILFPPRRFYQLQDWYAREDLLRFREQFAKSR